MNRSDLFSIDIENWVTLYNSCTSIKELKPQISKDFIAFASKQNSNPIKLGETKSSISLIPKDIRYYKFFENNPLFWMIPLELPDLTIIGFILKSYSKKEYKTVIYCKYNPFFGLYDFHDFTKNKLIVLTEGSKDCLFVKSQYKYTLGINTSKLTDKLIILLKYLSNKFLLLYDNDETGEMQKKMNSLSFLQNNLTVFNMKYQLKDPGEYFLASIVQKNQFNNELNKIIMLANRNC